VILWKQWWVSLKAGILLISWTAARLTDRLPAMQMCSEGHILNALYFGGYDIEPPCS
jgi:hypothetical protein